jgi:hypothetical protein
MVLWMKAVYGDEAAERWEELSDRILTVTPGLERGLQPVHLWRDADGAQLHHLCGLSHAG